MMKLPAAAFLLAIALSSAGHAAPLTPRLLDAPDAVVLVKDGCGIGFHRLPSGVCRPQPRGPRLMRLFARKCQLGYRRNLLGKCVKE